MLAARSCSGSLDTGDAKCVGSRASVDGNCPPHKSRQSMQRWVVAQSVRGCRYVALARREDEGERPLALSEASVILR